MIFRPCCAQALAVALVLWHSIGLCHVAEEGAALGQPKLPSTVVFSEKPLEKVVYYVGPTGTLAASVVVTVGPMSRPEVARAAGRAIAKKMFTSGLRRVYGIPAADEMVIEGLTVGREAFENGVYNVDYNIALKGVKVAKRASPGSPDTLGAVSSASPRLAATEKTSANPKLNDIERPDVNANQSLVDLSQSKSSSSPLTADERLKHEISSCSIAIDSTLDAMKLDSQFSFEAAAVDLKNLTERFKSKINSEIFFRNEEKINFCKQIDRLAESGFESIIELIK